MGQVPQPASRALRVLRFLASQPDPVPLDRITRACALPRSTAYHLLGAMIEEGFVVHLPDEHRYGLGVAAFEVGSGYSRQEPLQRISRRHLAELVDRTGCTSHLAVLHGRDVLYVRRGAGPGPSAAGDRCRRTTAGAPDRERAGDPVALPAAQVRALYPDRASLFTRTSTGPGTLAELRSLLAETRRRGHAREDGDVTTGFASVACAVRDRSGYPVAAVAVTFTFTSQARAGDPPHADWEDGRVDELVHRTEATAAALSRRLGATD